MSIVNSNKELGSQFLEYRYPSKKSEYVIHKFSEFGFFMLNLKDRYFPAKSRRYLLSLHDNPVFVIKALPSVEQHLKEKIIVNFYFYANGDKLYPYYWLFHKRDKWVRDLGSISHTNTNGIVENNHFLYSDMTFQNEYFENLCSPPKSPIIGLYYRHFIHAPHDHKHGSINIGGHPGKWYFIPEKSQAVVANFHIDVLEGRLKKDVSYDTDLSLHPTLSKELIGKTL